jgi:hypothetical protein
MPRKRPDFATIQLSEAGRRMAGDHGVIRWANSRRHFEFKAGEPQEVERSFEWNALLRNEQFEGESIFEEVPDEILADATDDASKQVSQALTTPGDEQPEAE